MINLPVLDAELRYAMSMHFHIPISPQRDDSCGWRDSPVPTHKIWSVSPKVHSHPEGLASIQMFCKVFWGPPACKDFLVEVGDIFYLLHQCFFFPFRCLRTDPCQPFPLSGVLVAQISVGFTSISCPLMFRLCQHMSKKLFPSHRWMIL